MLHTLLLNSSYETINFVSERKAFKLLAKDKVEVLCYWPNKVQHGRNGHLLHPAVIRLKYQVRWIPRKIKYSPRGVFLRDQYICQYCNRALTSTKATIDHVKPRAYGGESSWRNCVTACFDCNNQKGDRTPEQAGLKLLARPVAPEQSIISEYRQMKTKHPEWSSYLGLD
jgi:5-methylcytosine-specific restriction endonuclease McrA